MSTPKPTLVRNGRIVTCVGDKLSPEVFHADLVLKDGKIVDICRDGFKGNTDGLLLIDATDKLVIEILRFGYEQRAAYQISTDMSGFRRYSSPCLGRCLQVDGRLDVAGVSLRSFKHKPECSNSHHGRYVAKCLLVLQPLLTVEDAFASQMLGNLEALNAG